MSSKSFWFGKSIKMVSPSHPDSKVKVNTNKQALARDKVTAKQEGEPAAEKSAGLDSSYKELGY